MPRIIILTNLLAALWLMGFLAAAVTAGAPAAVACGSLGLLGYLAATVARIGAQQPPAPRPAPTARRRRAAR